MRMRPFLCAGVLAVAAAACGAKTPDPNNELPFGFLDAPAPNSPVPGHVTAVGWALDDTGVARIDVYVDRKYKMSVPVGSSRIDVGRAFPKYARDGNIHGWMAEIDLGATPGPREILVQAVDTSGAARDIGLVNVTVVPPAK